LECRQFFKLSLNFDIKWMKKQARLIVSEKSLEKIEFSISFNFRDSVFSTVSCVESISSRPGHRIIIHTLKSNERKPRYEKCLPFFSSEQKLLIISYSNVQFNTQVYYPTQNMSDTIIFLYFTKRGNFKRVCRWQSLLASFDSGWLVTA
jgi:hypothetical protein